MKFEEILSAVKASIWSLSDRCIGYLQLRKQRRLSRLIINELPEALLNGNIYLVYQPKFNLQNNNYDGVEVLLRWNHVRFGEIDRGELFRVVEKSGQVHSLTLWILQRVLEDQVGIGDQMLLPFNINVSGQSLCNDEFISAFCTLATKSLASIGVEITETAFIADPRVALANLVRLSSIGIRISIDDYGSGHSSLAYLKELPADEIKIDRLFISGMTKSNRDPLIVRSTIDLAHALGMQVVAEGVESQATLALLRMMGCDVAQGFYISPALLIADLRVFIADPQNLHRLSCTGVSVTPSRAFWARDERSAGADRA